MDYLILISTIVLGCATVFWLRLHEPHHVKALNAFTGAYLLALMVLHLLPDLYAVEHGTPIKPIVIGSFILVGFFLQIGLDALSQGVEHGHGHHIKGAMPIGILAGLCLHAFVEALALGYCPEHGHSHNQESRQVLLMSVVVHNFPVSIVLTGMLLQSGMKRSRVLMCLALFAAMAPLAMFISTHTGLAEYSRYLMAVVIGIFMHIATTILFETEDHHRFPLGKLFAVILGLGLGILSVIFGCGDHG